MSPSPRHARDDDKDDDSSDQVCLCCFPPVPRCSRLGPSRPSSVTPKTRSSPSSHRSTRTMTCRATRPSRNRTLCMRRTSRSRTDGCPLPMVRLAFPFVCCPGPCPCTTSATQFRFIPRMRRDIHHVRARRLRVVASGRLWSGRRLVALRLY